MVKNHDSCSDSPHNPWAIYHLNVGVQMRPMAVTRVCADHKSHLKISPNHKKKGLKLSGLSSSVRPQIDNDFWDLGFWDAALLEEGDLDHCDIAAKHKHTTPQKRNDEPRPTSMLLRLHYSPSANQMLVLFWTPSKKIITIMLIAITHF